MDTNLNNTIAAIDIGTNSFHMVIAKIDSKKRFTVLTRAKEVVRLGDSSNDMKYISPESMARGVETLKRFKLICDSYKAEVIAVATSATREAINKSEFLEEVHSETGIEINIVSGYEEARLIYLGVLQSLDVYDKRILLVDIGGGSTEFLLGERGEVNYANSVKIGSVRLTRKFNLDKKINRQNLKDAKTFVKNVMNQTVRSVSKEDYDIVIGSSGTINSIGSIIRSEKIPGQEYDMKLNGFIIKKKSLHDALDKIYKSETPEERSLIPGLDLKRTDIITAGAVILEQVFSELQLEKMSLSVYALREGIIMDYIQKRSGKSDFTHLKNVRLNSVMHLGDLTNFDRKHAEQVKKLAVNIFDFLKSTFGLNGEERVFLEAASLLHDIGYHISHTDHHKHSYYLIRHSEMLGFNEKEIEIIANIARYHRKSHPKIKHENFSKLDASAKNTVKKLAGILRIADALDRSHKNIVEEIDFEIDNKNFTIILKSCAAEPSLEIWGLNVRKGLFEECFERNVNVICLNSAVKQTGSYIE